MHEKRIQEAKDNFNQYVEDGLLKQEKYNEEIYKHFYKNAVESIQVAHQLLETSSLWTIVSSYYAMFYIASAFIYKKGYKAQHKIVHKVINDALIVLGEKVLKNKILEEYEEEKEKALSIAQNMLDTFEYERVKRARFQYEMGEEIKKSKAQTSLSRAKDFVRIFRELLNT